MTHEETPAWKQKLHEIIFEAETPAGKLFDILLIVNVLASVVVVMLDSVDFIRAQYGTWLYMAEWFFTIGFTIEYILRIISTGRPLKYIFSFFGIIDLLAIIPTYLTLFFPASRYLVVIRVIRVLRIFRVLKLVQYVGEADHLMTALHASRRKITVFLFSVLITAIILGSCIYLIEGRENGFTSIPRSVYWAIVTLTTVGYGDISPKTNLGQALAALIMILGYGIIAVPTGIVTTELMSSRSSKDLTRACPDCSTEGHDEDADFCKFCGSEL